MERYGFRVLAFSAYKNGRGDAIEQDDPDLRSFFHDAAASLRGRTLKGFPSLGVSDSGESPVVVPTLTVESALWVTGDHLHLSVSMGELNRFNRYTEDGQAPADISKGSAEEPFWVDLLFAAEGERGIAVVEVCQRRDALRLTNAHLTSEGRQIRRGDNDKKAGPYYVLRFNLLSDRERLEEVISLAKKATVSFTEHIPSPRGGQRLVKNKELLVPLHDQSDRDKALGVVDRWVKRISGEDHRSKREVVLEAQAEFGADDVPIDFDDAAIQLEGGAGSKRITPESVRDTFTYPMADGRPGVLDYLKMASARAEVLAVAHEVDHVTFDMEEAARCLGDSTSGPSELDSSRD